MSNYTRTKDIEQHISQIEEHLKNQNTNFVVNFGVSCKYI